ncbi:MAG: glycosyl hydrolase-related protein [Elusimicrobiota bacterium]
MIKYSYIPLISIIFLLAQGRQTIAEETIPSAKKSGSFSILLLPHNHADLSWMGTPGYCMDLNMEALKSALDLLDKYPEYKYSIETAIILREYIRRYPRETVRIKKYINEGRLDCGGFYTGIWELKAGGETLIRNLYFGKRWLLETLDYDTKVAWNVDLPGHTWQIPQLLSKAGIDLFITWRGFQGPWLSVWESPDESTVIQCEFPKHYINPASYMDPYGFFREFENKIKKDNLPDFLIGSVSGDCSIPGPEPVTTLKKWDNSKEKLELGIVSASDILSLIEPSQLHIFRGENPSTGDLGTSKLRSVIEDGLPVTEKIASLAGMLVPEYSYPSQQLTDSWNKWLQNLDHNWGGVDGDISNSLKIKDLITLIDTLLTTITDSTGIICENINFAKKGIPITVFNVLARSKEDMVYVSISSDTLKSYGRTGALSLKDPDGTNIAVQLLSENEGNKKIAFIANVPPMGYKTYYLELVKKAKQSKTDISIGENSIENSFFRIEFDTVTGCISEITDIPNNRVITEQDIPDFGEFLVIEYSTDNKTGAMLPSGRTWTSSAYPSTGTIAKRGPVWASVKMVTGFFEDNVISREISLYRGLSKIDVSVNIETWNSIAKNRGLFLEQVFPVKKEDDTRLSFQIPFAHAAYPDDIHPHSGYQTGETDIGDYLAVKNWLCLSSEDYWTSFTSWSGNFRVISRDPDVSNKYIVQPLLINTSRFTGLDKEFSLIPSTCSFMVSIITGKGSPDPSLLTRRSQEFHYNSGFMSVVSDPGQDKGRLPDKFSFLSVEPETIMVSAIKPAEDNKGLIIRFYNSSDTEKTGFLEFYRPVKKAFYTSILEYDKEDIIPDKNRMPFKIGKFSIETVRVFFK